MGRLLLQRDGELQPITSQLVTMHNVSQDMGAGSCIFNLQVILKYLSKWLGVRGWNEQWHTILQDAEKKHEARKKSSVL